MLKASKHEANLKMRSPLGSLKTTTLIGGRCTGGNVLSRAVLITRKLSCREPFCRRRRVRWPEWGWREDTSKTGKLEITLVRQQDMKSR